MPRIALFLDRDLYYDRQVLAGILAFTRERPDWRLLRSLGLPMIARDFFGKVESDGLILHPYGITADMLARQAQPAVSVSYDCPELGLPVVANDDAETGRLVARHFLSQGFRHFAFKGMSNKEFSHRREQGFAEELDRHRAGPVHRLLLRRIYSHRQTAWFRIGKIREWLARLPKPVAVLACNDLDALEVAEACQLLDLGIPEEVAIAGVDNDPFFTELMAPPLTSVEQNGWRIGYEAARRLDRLLRGLPLPEPVLAVPPRQLVVRKSTEIQAVADPLVSRALSLIRADPAGLRGSKDLLSRLGCSRSLLDKKFRAALGRTAFAEILRVRLDLAKRLLEDSPGNLSEIAQACGFADLKDFSHFFLQRTGLRPSAFRKRLAGTAASAPSGSAPNLPSGPARGRGADQPGPASGQTVREQIEG